MAVRSGLVTTRIASNAYRNEVVARPMPAPVSTSTTSALSPAASRAATRRRRRLACRSAISGRPDPPPASRTPSGPSSAMSSIVAPNSMTSITVRRGCIPRSRCRFARPMSASTATTLIPDAARWTARLLVRIDFPVPPLPLVTQTTIGRGRAAGDASLTRVSSRGLVSGAGNGETPRSYRPRPSRRLVNRSSSRRSPAAIEPLALEALEFLHLFDRQRLERARERRLSVRRDRSGRRSRLVDLPWEPLLRPVRPRHVRLLRGCHRRSRCPGRILRVGQDRTNAAGRGLGLNRRKHTFGPERLPAFPSRFGLGSRLDAVETEQSRRGLDDRPAVPVARVNFARQAGRDPDRQQGQAAKAGMAERGGEEKSDRRTIAVDAPLGVQSSEKIALVGGPEMTVEHPRQRRLRVPGGDHDEGQAPRTVDPDCVEACRRSRSDVEVEKAKVPLDDGGVGPDQGADQLRAAAGAGGDARWQRTPRSAGSACDGGPDPAGPVTWRRCGCSRLGSVPPVCWSRAGPA